MRSLCVAFCMTLALAAPALAAPAIAFGAAVPGQSIEDVTNALPDLDWRYFYDPEDDQTLVGALASDAVQFDGQRWLLRLGTTSSFADFPYAYSFELSRSSRYEREDQCETEFARTIAALEPSLGAFAPGDLTDIHPVYDSGPREAEPREESAGTISHVRVFPRPRTSYRDRGYDIVAVRDVQLDPATVAVVYAINTRDRYDGPRSQYTLVVGYSCSVTIAFRRPLPD